MITWQGLHRASSSAIVAVITGMPELEGDENTQDQAGLLHTAANMPKMERDITATERGNYGCAEPLTAYTGPPATRRRTLTLTSSCSSESPAQAAPFPFFASEYTYNIIELPSTRRCLEVMLQNWLQFSRSKTSTRRPTQDHGPCTAGRPQYVVLPHDASSSPTCQYMPVEPGLTLKARKQEHFELTGSCINGESSGQNRTRTRTRT